jgi:hypothetical protein
MDVSSVAPPYVSLANKLQEQTRDSLPAARRQARERTDDLSSARQALGAEDHAEKLPPLCRGDPQRSQATRCFHPAVDELKLAAGEEACAVVKASDVMVGIDG